LFSFPFNVRGGRYANMAEVAGVLSVYENVKSCIAIAQSIYSILAKAKDAPRERQQYLDVVEAVIRSLESLPRRLENAQKGNSWSQGLLALVEPAKRFVPDKASSEAEPPEGTWERWGHKIDGGFAKIGLDGVVPGKKSRSQKGPTTMMWMATQLPEFSSAWKDSY